MNQTTRAETPASHQNIKQIPGDETTNPKTQTYNNESYPHTSPDPKHNVCKGNNVKSEWTPSFPPLNFNFVSFFLIYKPSVHESIYSEPSTIRYYLLDSQQPHVRFQNLYVNHL